MTDKKPALRVLLQNIDYILVPPGPLDRSDLPLVPLIRIYGDSSLGKKACAIIHQVYPYFFIEYTDDISPDNVVRYIRKLTRSLNHALALSLKRNPASRKSRYVRSIILVKGVHFYGFHSSYSPFLKIYISNPQLMHRAVTVLQSGMVMRTKFRVYESHLNFALQFMCDFGLYGCGWVDFDEEIYQRGEEDSEMPEATETTVATSNGSDLTTPQFKTSPHYRHSTMALEADIAAHQILNRLNLQPRNVNHKPENPTPTLPAEPLVPSVRELWDDERRRRTARGLDPSPIMPQDLSDKSRGKGGGWVAEAMWWTELRERIQRERDSEAVSLEDTADWEGWVMTTFESVQALWERPWKTWTAPNLVTKLGGVDQVNPFDSEHEPVVVVKEEPDDIDIDLSLLSDPELELSTEGEATIKNNEDDDDESDEENDEEPADEEYIDDPEPEEVVVQVNDDSKDPFEDDSVQQDDKPPDAYSLPKLHGKVGSDADEDSHRSLSAYLPIPSILMSPHSDSGSMTPTQSGKRNLPSSLLLNDTVEDQEESGRDISDRPKTPTIERQLRFAPVRQSARIQPTPIGKNVYRYAISPPSVAQLTTTNGGHEPLDKMYQAPYYSDKADAPVRPREYAGLLFHIPGGTGLETLEEWAQSSSQLQPTFKSQSDALYQEEMEGWEYTGSPPSFKQVKLWAKHNSLTNVLLERARKKAQSQISGPTQANIYGMKHTPLVDGKGSMNQREDGQMSVFSLEVFATSEDYRVSDPETDEIAMAFYSFLGDDKKGQRCRKLMVEAEDFATQQFRDPDTEAAFSELDLINRLVDIIIELDPDVITGWEVQLASWGYVQRRAAQYSLDFAELIGRASESGQKGGGVDQWGLRKTSTFKVVGRHVLNLWRVIRKEFTLNVYTFENAVFQLLGRRFPRYNSTTLMRWYTSPVTSHIVQLVQHFSTRTLLNIDILEAAEVIAKTSEFARVFGVDFFSVLSRGSQFKVESFMLRIAKPESFVLISPNKADVGKQNAAECGPLIMEPLSAFYSNPLLVLDFQSLYPSVMIAYNYCYSTCLGRIQDYQGRPKLGVTDLHLPNRTLETLESDVTVAPNGIMYVKPVVRKGLLGRMLAELLDTRVMVKTAMKDVKTDKGLQRILNARQLGLKYIANVTYGASFSGRMPCVEIADSIVQTGREILETAVRTIDSTKEWGAQVVYGDTDSVFVYLKGKTKEQAFRIGNDIAEHITALNPSPIKLKFEKVYLPCVLMAKKRYVGFKYESMQDEPVFDAKGIETVRRDGVPAQQKMVENCLKILFRSQDLSEVKNYCWSSWMRIIDGHASLQDFIFAKEVKLGTYSDVGPPPPGAVVAAQRMLTDKNDEVQYGERVPYVITRGDPGTRLVDRATAPLDVLDNPHMHLDAAYYITRVLIPPLERVFNLVGANVRAWYDEMPRAITELNVPMSPSKKHAAEVMNALLNRPDIDEHFSSLACIICGGGLAEDDEGVCEDCQEDPVGALPLIMARLHTGETRLMNAQLVCMSCTGTPAGESVECESLDCPWLYERKKVWRSTEILEIMRDVIGQLEDLSEEMDLEDRKEAEMVVALESDEEEEWEDVEECHVDEPFGVFDAG